MKRMTEPKLDGVIGIDPGLNGAIAFLSFDRNTCKVLPLTTKGKNLNFEEIVLFLLDLYESKHEATDVFIEAVHAMPKQGVTSTFTFGHVTGSLFGYFTCLNYKITSIRPQEWKNLVLPKDNHSKEASIAFCKKSYPGVSLLRTKRSRKDDDGIADAVCIAEAGLILRETKNDRI